MVCCIAIAQTAAPPALQPADAQHVVASLSASGVQIYVCKPDQNNHLAWTFKAPQADLYDGSGKLVVKHYAGPSWEASDGSKITGKVVAHADATEAGAIAWLLLKTESAGAPGRFDHVRAVQRLFTSGGSAPAGAWR